MRCSVTATTRRLQRRHQATPPFGLNPRICLRCQAGLSSQRNTSRVRAFGTSQARSAESIRPETHYDYFRTVLPQGPPPQGPFAIDTKALRKQFLQMQGEAHPDHHSQDMKGRAEALSSQINEAYKTLSDPLLRTQYLLSLRGIDVAEDETAKVEDQGLLMQVLESQEVIEEAESEKDLEGLKQTNHERLEESVKILEQAFEKDDIDTAKKEAVRLRYWTNIRDGIRSFEPGKPVTLIH